MENNKKCLCKEPLCAKCLGVNCREDNCKVHTLENKIKYKQRMLNNISNKLDIDKLEVEIMRLSKLLISNKIKDL